MTTHIDQGLGDCRVVGEAEAEKDRPLHAQLSLLTMQGTDFLTLLYILMTSKKISC
jgi:hypothetical protein